MNIVFFIQNLNSGGIENYLLRFLKIHNQDFDDIHIWCKSKNEGRQLEKEYQQLPNISIITEPLGYLSISKYRSVIRFLKRESIDVVCDFTGNFGGLTMLSAYLASVKKRLVFYRSSTDHFRSSYVNKLYNRLVNHLVYRFSSDILSNSEAGLDYFFENRWRNNLKFEVIYNGVDIAVVSEDPHSSLRDELGISPKGFVIGHIGRYSPAKNHDTILEVVDFLLPRYDDFYFIMCGNDVETKLKSRIVDKAYKSRVFLFENRSDVSRVLNALDCFYFPSLTEGQPNALIEAMMVGLPIVASNIAPIKETVSVNYQSTLVNPCDVLGAVRQIEEIYFLGDRRKMNFDGLKRHTQKRFAGGANFLKFLNRIKST